MGFLKEMIKLTRFEHALMLAFAVFIAETIALHAIPDLTSTIILLSLFVPIFSEMGSFALNDYLDIETDKLNKKKDRPLVNGTISPKFAFWFSILCLLISVVLAYFVNYAAFVIAIIFNLAAIAYNWKLKDLPLVGNFYIGLTMAIPFIFGFYVVSNIEGITSITSQILILAALGFVAGLAREIIKSAQDLEGDVLARGSKTLPAVIGKRNSVLVAIILYLLFVPLTYFALNGLGNLIATALVVLGDLLILKICIELYLEKPDAFKSARKMSLIGFGLGLLGLFIGAI